MQTDHYVTPLDLKFASDPATGEFEGYGAVFGNVDGHGDVILPGAFTASLAERKANGRGVPMHINHGISLLGGRRGVGVWKTVEEDGKGLRVAGKISGMNTDGGRMLYEQVKDGAYPGLSVGFRVAPNGVSYRQKASDPRRTLKALHLAEVSLVDDPANPSALVDGIKASLHQPDTAGAAAAIGNAMRLHDKSMSNDSYDSRSSKDRAMLMNHLRDAHEALTGSRAPDGLDGWKADLTLREFEEILREKGFSRSQAAQIAERGFKSLPRDEDGGDAYSPTATALKGLLDGFSLPTFDQ